VRAAAREPVHQPAVHGPEGHVALLLVLPHQPLELGGGEIGIRHEAGAGGDEAGVELAAAIRGAPVLPDDRAMDRLAGLPVPQDRGLALVGDADRRDVAAAHARVAEGFAGGGERDPPDLLGVVLDPAGLRKMLGQLAIAAAENVSAGVEDERGGTGGALIEGEYQAHLIPK
jgi:hypothetical protein